MLLMMLLKMQEIQKFFLMMKFLKILVIILIIIFVSLHQLINQVVKGVTGSSFRRSLLFYSPRTLSKVSLRCAASQLDMPSTIKRTPVLSPKQQDIFLLRDI